MAQSSSHNKGKRYILCKECGRKRYCLFRPLPDDHREATCSKGHVWNWPLPTLERINNIIKEQISDKVSTLFDRDDAFYTSLRKR